MKKILFVLDSLGCGGSERSLVNLLNAFDKSRADVDLLLFNRGSVMENSLPAHIKLLPVPTFFRFLQMPWHRRLFSMQWSFIWHSLKLSIGTRLNSIQKRPLHPNQVAYVQIKDALAILPKRYDVAIAYAQGFPTYFVADKVTAGRKLAWINCDYEKTLYDKKKDEPFYAKYDAIVAISEHVRRGVERMFGDQQKKIQVIYFFDAVLIREMAEKGSAYNDDFSGIKILTVGRLVSVKNYPLAITTCLRLRNAGYRLRWYVIGEGPERAALEKLILEKKLNNDFILLGQKSNPFPWMKNCDIYVQTSKHEGFCRALIEAKTLHCPIVCTDFGTSHEILENGKNGIVVGKSAEDLFQGIKEMLDSPGLRERLIEKIKAEPSFDSTEEINKFYLLAEL